jgi:hypothetical protein
MHLFCDTVIHKVCAFVDSSFAGPLLISTRCAPQLQGYNLKLITKE